MRVSREHLRARSLQPLFLTLGVTVLVAPTLPGPASVASAAVPAAPQRAAVSPEPVSPDIVDFTIPAAPATLAARVPAEVTSHDGHDVVVASHLRQTQMKDFGLAGVTWQPGTAPEDLTVTLRAKSEGTWSEWVELEYVVDEGPNGTEATTARDGTAPVWVGDSTGLEVVVASADGSAPEDLQVSAIDPGTSPYDAVVTSQEAQTASSGPQAGTFPSMPRVITRRGWGADESLGDRCFSPRWGTGFRAVIVHHTVSSNSYSRSESASIVRGIHAYHTQSQGWCDIGYNFLVDRYGRVFEGRDGGIRRPVRGAHAGDYNTNTTGISLIGNFESARPTRAMKHQLVQLIAWRMGTAYHGAYGAPRVYDRKIRRISGHRDVMSTACPGRYVYSWLPALRKRVATRLGNYQSAIERMWLRKGGRGGSYGDVIMGERGQRKGRITIFRRGRIYAKDGVFPLRRNPVTRKYVDVGEVHSSMGFPRSHVHNVKRRGTFAVFRHGRIYWSRPTGAKVLHSSPILRRYRTLGGANSRLRFPRTRVIQTRTGSTARFQNGRITFYKRSGKTRVSYS